MAVDLIPYQDLRIVGPVDQSSRVFHVKIKGAMLAVSKSYVLADVPHTSLCSDMGICDRLTCIQRSLACWLSCRHKTIAQFVGLSVSPLNPSSLLLLTEDAEHTLDRHLERVSMVTVPDLVHIAKSVLAALVYLHGRRITHGCLSTKTILVYRSHKGGPLQMKLSNIGGVFPEAPTAPAWVYATPEGGTSMPGDMFAFGMLLVDLVTTWLYDARVGTYPGTRAVLRDNNKAACIKAAASRLASSSPALATLILDCCTHTPAARADAKTTLFRLNLYTMPPGLAVVEAPPADTAALVAACKVIAPLKKRDVAALVVKPLQVKPVLDAMLAHPLDPTVQLAAATALTKCCCKEENRPGVAETPAHLHVLTAMVQWPEDEPLVCACASALTSFVGMDGMRPHAVRQLRAIVLDGGIAILTHALVRHHNNLAVVRPLLQLFSALARELEAKRALVRYMALEHIVDALNVYQAEADVCGHALRACSRVCDGFPKGLNRFVAISGMQLMYSAMDSHRGDEVVQIYGSRVMEVVTRDGTGLATLFSESYGLKRLYKAMDRHLDLAGLQAAACRTLSNFSGQGSYNQFVFGTEGLSRLYHAMEHHRPDYEVMLPALQTMLHISRIPDAIDVMVRSYAVVKVAHVMDAHQFREGIVALCCAILVNIVSYDGGTYRRRLVLSPSLLLTITAVARIAEDEPVQRHACELLAEVTAEEEFVPVVADGGAVIPLVATLRRPSMATRAGVLAPALRTLANLCVFPGNVAPTIGEGAVEHAAKAAEANPESAEVQAGVLALFARLCDNEPRCGAVFAAGGLTIIHTAMARHLDAVAVQLNGCRALEALARVPTLASRIVQSTGLQRVQAAMFKHIRVVEVAESGLAALAALAQWPANTATAMLEAGVPDYVLIAMDRMPDACGVLAQGCRFMYGLSGSGAGRHDLMAREVHTRLLALRAAQSDSPPVLTWANMALKRLTPPRCPACVLQ